MLKESVTVQTADLVIAPELIVAEVCSAFRKYVRARALSGIEAEKLTGQALSLVDKVQPLQALVADVFALTARTDSSVYDLFYLALAQRTGATLLTADVSLRQTALGLGIDVAAP
jgi:predicted nucleic acid-binding protein